MATAPMNCDEIEYTRLMNSPQNDLRSVGAIDTPPSSLSPLTRKGYIVIATQ